MSLTNFITQLGAAGAGAGGSNKYAVVSYIGTLCLELFDVSDPSNIVSLDTYTHPTSITPLLTVSPTGNYLAAREGKNIHIFDISEGLLTFVTTYTTTASTLRSVAFLAEDVGLLVGVGAFNNELQVFSFDGSSVSLINTYTTTTGTLNPGVYYIRVTDDGQYAILINGGGAYYMAIYSISYDPITLTSLYTSSNLGSKPLPISVDATSDSSYAALAFYDSSLPSNPKIEIYDITTKSSPSLIGSDTYTSPERGFVGETSFSPDGQLLYTTYNYKFGFIDASTKSSPSIEVPGYSPTYHMAAAKTEPHVFLEGDGSSGSRNDFAVYYAPTNSLTLLGTGYASDTIRGIAVNY
jgi:hypothetical protein